MNRSVSGQMVEGEAQFDAALLIGDRYPPHRTHRGQLGGRAITSLSSLPSLPLSDWARNVLPLSARGLACQTVANKEDPRPRTCLERA